ncbi:Fermentation-respiration switch protein FrsA, has esterase activity, DUF1100 family [Seinonella peptonophila]|uniref:Fermentation-respiration switch protein FrsA, has esterase activity, DUF1100 family n=1 Tax=Seinonella peptonophila TaxID=112248 RepID=A0A1M4USJ0_9BACL|nr:alpha/beta hydrolase [Seinonella peptonophila]SHE59686.1 Fermentation-respiration switch protein FrsA, has esterase activity, DUF1100 family [Seinonella peptonophila]
MNLLNRKSLIYGSLGAASTVASLSTGISLYALRQLMHPPREKVNMKPEDIGCPDYEEIRIRSGSISLAGWFVFAKKSQLLDRDRENKGLPLAILLHGYRCNRTKEESLPAMIRFLTSAGLNVLSYDARAHGESEGEFSTVGNYEGNDLLNVYHFTKESGFNPVLVYGVSMGAATAATQLPKMNDVQLAVLDSTFTGLNDLLSKDFDTWTPLPKIPFTYQIVALTKLMRKISPSHVRPIDQIKQQGFPPALIFHGKNDLKIPPYHGEALWEAAANDARLILADSLDHAKVYRGYATTNLTVDREKYDQREYPRRYLTEIGQAMVNYIDLYRGKEEIIQQALTETLAVDCNFSPIQLSGKTRDSY